MLHSGRVVLLIFTLFVNSIVVAQTPWSGAYGNEWLAGKYGQMWLRIGVNQKGIFKVTLPASFQNKQKQLHLYHRGKEVPLITATATEIEFYGIQNDGASDVLLYRPIPEVRQNPYYSWFSDESAYFLTYTEAGTAKMITQQKSSPLTGTIEPYHLQKDLTVYSDEYTHDETTNVQYFALDQSYYDVTKSNTGILHWHWVGGKPVPNPIFSFPFKLKGLVIDKGRQPVIDVLINGRTFTNNQIKASVGKTETSLRDYAGLIEFSNFIPYKQTFTLQASADASGSDVGVDGSGYFKLESKKVTEVISTTGAYSVTYIQLIYPQKFDMTGVVTNVFNLVATSASLTRISVANAPNNARVFDITDPDTPKAISGTYSGSTLDLMVERTGNKELNLLVTSESKPVSTEKVYPVTFTEFNAADNDYLIITNETLFTSAEKYAAYRMSSAGGAYKTLTVKIKDIYNQFNYGEPSPVAIRHFVDYMVKNSARQKHNLLLVGPSTTFPSHMKLNRELPEEVPTIGYPGSDVLLVEGLTPTSSDVPSIPVGRISATTTTQVDNYLSKVVYFEASKNTFDWKKKVLHLNGGKSVSEISQLKTLLEDLVPVVENSFLGGQVVPYVKKSLIEVEKVDDTFSGEVNDGVGMISYLGHGSPTVTDLDYGYVTDLSRGYVNAGKYPLQYFNGCGVGNIFSGRFNTSPTSKDRLPVSSDWTTAADKGGIAVIANTYYSYVTSSSKYLNYLYSNLFGTDPSELSIGQIQQKAAKEILRTSSNDYDVANIHQSLLQGDPALKLFKVDYADYSMDSENSIFLHSESAAKNIGQSSSIRTGIVIANKGRFVKTQQIPVRLTYVYKIGGNLVKDTLVSSVALADTFFFSTPNKQALSRVTAEIDHANTLKELSKENNKYELVVDWEIAKEKFIYPSGTQNDLIAPVVKVEVNGIEPKNNSKLAVGSVFNISLYDDNTLSKDSSYLEVFVKSCISDDCDYRRLSYSKNEINLNSFDGNGLSLSLSTTQLGTGVWEMMITGKDKKGNKMMPYKVIFNLSDGLSPSLSVWPNPASNYVTFEISELPAGVKAADVFIYDSQGRVVEQKVLNSPGKWYWTPKVSSGSYIYKWILKSEDGNAQSFTGKIVLVK